MKAKLTALALAVVFASSLSFADQALPAGATFEVGFSPSGQSLNVVLKTIESARSSILVAAYSFTSKPIASALLQAHKRGVKVALVADMKDNSKGYSAAQYLANQGVPVHLNGNYAILHDKFMVIDGMHVQTGSFNYSAAAVDRNAENVLLLWNVKPLADQYAHEWQRLWAESPALPPSY